jgi:hypothetical protein
MCCHIGSPKSSNREGEAIEDAVLGEEVGVVKLAGQAYGKVKL